MDGTDPSSEVPTADAGATPEAPASSGRVRAGLVGALGVLTVLLLIISTIGIWARVTVFSTSRSVAIVDSALQQPEVADAFATYLTTQVVTAVDLESKIEDALPPNLQQFAPAIAAGIEQVVQRGLGAALDNPKVAEAVDAIVGHAHQLALKLLEGDGLTSGHTVENGEVSVNLLPLIDRGIRQIAETGLIDKPDYPPMTVDGDHDAQLAQLEDATGRDLPDDFGQLVIYRSDQLAHAQEQLSQAQRIVAISKRAVVLLALLTIALGVATVALSRNRWRGLLWLSLGAATGMVLLRASVREVVNAAPDLAKHDGGRVAIDAIATKATSSLLHLAAAMLVISIVLALVALVERNWPREDYGPISAAVGFAAVIALLGVTIGGLVVGIAVAIGLPYLVQRGHLEHAARSVVDHVKPDHTEPPAADG